MDRRPKPRVEIFRRSDSKANGISQRFRGDISRITRSRESGIHLRFSHFNVWKLGDLRLQQTAIDHFTNENLVLRLGFAQTRADFTLTLHVAERDDPVLYHCGNLVDDLGPQA